MLSNENTREKVVASIEHGSRGEELRLSLIKNRGQTERLELRNWLWRDDLAGERRPGPHVIQISLEIVPWLIRTLEGLVPFEREFEREMVTGGQERPEIL